MRPTGRSALALIALAALAVGALLIARGGTEPGVARPAPVAGYGDLPLSFQPNRGQSAGAVRFLANAPGFGLYLTGSGAVLDLGRSALSMRFLGAAPAAPLRGVGRLPGTVNYLTPGGSSRRTGIPTFAGVRYTGLWPGIDARFYGDQHRLEYDFDLAPGASAAEIEVRFAGQRRLAIGAGGALLISLGGRTLRQPPPRATQAVAGRVQVVPSHYVLRGGGRVGIALAPYDHSRPLRIDPRILFAAYLLEGIDSPARDVAVDGSGSAYIAGQTSSPQLPLSPGAASTEPPGHEQDVSYVTKLSPDGRRIVYSTYFGSHAGAYANGLAVDRQGAAYLVGMAYPGGIPTTPGALQTQPAGEPVNGFVAKLAPSGRRLVYSTYLAGKSIEGGEVDAIAVDAQGNAYLSGETEAPNFPVTSGTAQVPVSPTPVVGPRSNVFVAKLDPTGSHLIYSKVIGGGAWDRVGGIAVDPAGEAVVVGSTNSRDLPVTPGALQPQNNSDDLEFPNTWVAKLDPAGETFTYVTYLGGSLADEGNAVAVDAAGDAYVTGDGGSRDFPTTAGTIQHKRHGFDTAYVAVINPEGTRLLRSTLLGNESSGRGIALDAAGNVYLAGFRLAPERHHRSHGYRGFFAELNPALTRLRAWQKVGGAPARAASVALAGNGDAYVAGGSGPGMPTTNALSSTEVEGRSKYPSAFVTKLRP